MLSMLEKFGSEEEGDASISALCNGIGTSDEENGVAPGENGTLGLLVPLIVILLPKFVMNEPAKKRLEAEELVVMDRTSPAAPPKPPNGGADHEFALVSHIATDDPGEEKRPPTHTLSFGASQKIELTSPFGPSLASPNAVKVWLEDENDATLLDVVPFIDEKRPAKKYESPRAQPVFIRPPAFVEPSRVREPSDARERRVAEEGSKVSDEEVSNRSKPANVPARPT
jgi:hypothetical protein